jgi:hypothetical protein
MASQIAHIIYAKKYFDKLEKGEIVSGAGQIDRDEFILGCVFPDIRLIDESIKRKDTHLKFSPLDLNFSGLTSFEAGWKYHLYCDMKREEILNKYGFYNILGTTDFSNRPAKFFEDWVIYDGYNNWEKLVYYFNGPPYFENSAGASKETFELWYAIIAKYIETAPDEKTTRALIAKLPDIREKSEGIMNSISKIKKSQKAVEILKKVWQEIV